MSDNDDQLKNAVTRLLESWHFHVRQLERTPNSRTADLLVTQNERYLIELKQREDDPVRLATARAQLDRGEIAETSDTVGYKNRVSGIIRSGVDQLRSHRDITRDFGLLWLHSAGAHPDVKMRQFLGTLYGTTNIIDLEGDQYHRPCYYFYNSECFRYRADLDGVILSGGSEAQLCINSLSPRAVTLRGSELAKAFAYGVLDPDAKEAAGEAYVADTDVNRHDREAVLQYLRQKSGRPKLTNIDMGFTSVAIAVQRGDAEPSGGSS